MRVLHLLASNVFSGAENVVCQIINLFRHETGTEMVYCSPDGPIRQAVGQREVPFLPLEALSYREVKRAILQYRPDVIHAHDLRASVLAAACGKDCRVISHIHGRFEDMKRISPRSLLYHWADSGFHKIFWVSKSAMETYRYRPSVAEKSEVLVNVIDRNDLFEKRDTDQAEYDYDVVFLGRLSYVKNPQRLLAVFRLVRDRVPGARLCIIGDGDLREEVQNLTKEWGLMESVDFLGFRENPYKILSDSKIMLMTSRSEGTPMCALEAMALGLPVVSTPTDGLVELIEDGACGFVREEDAELACCIADILENEALQQRLSEGAVKRAEVWNHIDAYRERLTEAYRG